MSAYADQNHAPGLTCVRLKVFNSRNADELRIRVATVQREKFLNLPIMCEHRAELLYPSGTDSLCCLECVQIKNVLHRQDKSRRFQNEQSL